MNYEKIIKAVKLVYENGIDAYIKVSELVGKDVALAIVIAHLRKKMSANDPYPFNTEIDIQLKDLLIKEKIISDSRLDSNSSEFLQEYFKEIESLKDKSEEMFHKIREAIQMIINLYNNDGSHSIIIKSFKINLNSKYSEFPLTIILTDLVTKVTGTHVQYYQLDKVNDKFKIETEIKRLINEDCRLKGQCIVLLHEKYLTRFL